MSRWRRCGAVLLGLMLAAADAPPAEIQTATSGIVDGARADDGSIWFDPWTEGVRFVVSPQSIDGSAIFDVLRAAADGNQSVSVRFDPTSGRFDRESGRISYRVCALGFDQKQFGRSGELCPSRTPWAEHPSPEAAIALGVGAATGQDYRRALRYLDQGLSSREVPAQLRLIGYRVRGTAHVGIAHENGETPSDSSDERLLLALADARSWAALAPRDVEARFEIAYLLEALGAYDEAAKAYEDILSGWPDEDYRVQVRIGALRRLRGDYAGALQALEALVARSGAQTGMRYHYHRGWTLTLLGRYEEAVAEFSEGLKTQPDYSWAYLRRACALGRIGEIEAAAADQLEGVKFLKLALAGGPRAKVETDMIERARVILKELQNLANQSSTQPTSAACEGYSEPGGRRRSRLLPSG